LWVSDICLHLLALHELPTNWNSTLDATFNESIVKSSYSTKFLSKFQKLETGSVICFFSYVGFLALIFALELFPLLMQYVMKLQVRVELKKISILSNPEGTLAGRELAQVQNILDQKISTRSRQSRSSRLSQKEISTGAVLPLQQSYARRSSYGITKRETPSLHQKINPSTTSDCKPPLLLPSFVYTDEEPEIPETQKPCKKPYNP